MKLFCAETLWDNDISEKRTSYKSLMDLVSNETWCDVSYFTFNTKEELTHLFDIFRQKKYTVFYLASHMRDGDITSGYKQKFNINIPDILKKNGECFTNRILHLAGCSSMANISHKSLLSIKNFTNLKVLSGYNKDTDTTESSAMDLLYLVNLARDGEKNLNNKLKEAYPDLIRASGFEMYVMKEIN